MKSKSRFWVWTVVGLLSVSGLAAAEPDNGASGLADVDAVEGEIAENLNRLYGFMMMHLTMVNTENSAQAAREVIDLLEPLRRSWNEIAECEGANGPSKSSSGDPTSAQVSLSA